MLIESDILLAALKKEDRLKADAELILEKIDSGKIKGVYASTATLQEIIFWFYNRQLFNELTAVINLLSHLRNVEWIPISPEICITASLLINEKKLSPFDAYHAATALGKDKTILSTEHTYNKIEGLTRIDPAEFAKDL